MSSKLYEKITSDIKTAMIDHMNTKRDCLRSIISDIKNATVNAGKEITDDICLKVIKRSVKQHEDSIESFRAGNRQDLALKEMEELTYISDYMPKMMTEDEMKAVVDGILSEVDPVKKNMGLVMKTINTLPDKDRIDRKFVSNYLNGVLK